MDFTKNEEVLMMLYSPGTRLGLIAALKEMSAKLDQKKSRGFPSVLLDCVGSSKISFFIRCRF